MIDQIAIQMAEIMKQISKKKTPILLAMFCLEALLFTGCKESGESSSKSANIRVEAVMMVNASDLVRSTVSSILIQNGNSEELSFERNDLDGYQNPRCNSDRCRVFGDKNDQIKSLPLLAYWLDQSYKAQPTFGDWLFTGSFCIDGLGKGGADCDTDGSDNEELIAMLPWVKKEYCESISFLITYELQPSYSQLSCCQPHKRVRHLLYDAACSQNLATTTYSSVIVSALSD